MQVTLAYHSKLEDAWTEAARKLQERLNKLPHAEGSTVGIIGRSKNQKVVLDRDFVLEKMDVDGKTFHYKQVQIWTVGSASPPLPPFCDGQRRDFAGDTTCACSWKARLCSPMGRCVEK